MSRGDWMDRYPGVKRLLEQPDALPRHVYTLDYCAGETIRVGERVSVDGECAVRWAPGRVPLGIALTPAAPGDTVRIQLSEVYFAH